MRAGTSRSCSRPVLTAVRASWWTWKRTKAATRSIERKHHEVLPGEFAHGLLPSQTHRLHFLDRLGFAHLVRGQDRDAGILRAIFDQRDASTGLQGPRDGGHHLTRVRELVIH